MKNKIFIIALFLCMSLNMAAQTNGTHIVQRGETIESVASKYGITVADLQQANPDTKTYFFVGMKLTIPQVAVNDIQKQQTTENGKEFQSNIAPISETSNITPVIPEKPSAKVFTYVLPGDDDSFEGKTYNVCFEFGCNLGPKHERANGRPLGFLVSVGANLRITTPFYVGARLGYFMNTDNYSVKGTSENYENTYHSLILPLEIGYSLSTRNRKFALTPVVGLIPSVSLGGKTKYNKEEEKVKGGDLSIAYYAGIRIRLWRDYVLSAQYVFQKIKGLPGNSGEIKGSPIFSIGWGF